MTGYFVTSGHDIIVFDATGKEARAHQGARLAISIAALASC